ncbi:MAG: phosphodiesterase [Tagaea sp.]
MLIAQLTDPHILAEGRNYRGRVDTAAGLARAVAALRARRLRPDCVLLTGDCVDAGAAEEYANLRRVLAPLDVPVFPIPGNHDARGPFLAAFPDIARRVGDFPFVQYVVDEFPVRLVALDTLDEGKPGGVLCDRRLAWLEDVLARGGDKPTLIFLHHPPFATGIAAMDAMGLAAPEKLAAIVARHPNVEHVAAGHLHRAIETRFAGTIASCAPATAHQVALGLGEGAPFGFTLEPPGHRLFLWREGAGLVAHLATHAPFEGPYAWRDGTALAGS